MSMETPSGAVLPISPNPCDRQPLGPARLGSFRSLGQSLSNKITYGMSLLLSCSEISVNVLSYLQMIHTRLCMFTTPGLGDCPTSPSTTELNDSGVPGIPSPQLVVLLMEPSVIKVPRSSATGKPVVPLRQTCHGGRG